MRLAELNRLAEDPNLWDDPQKAQKLMQERTMLEDRLGAIGNITREVEDQIGMIELGDAEGDESVVLEAEDALRQIRKDVARRELEALLSGEADSNDTYLEVHAGAGGTESQDWANMLLRMYTRWAEQHGYKIEYLEETQGEEAGIKSATIQIKGHNAYGWLKTEDGVHRLVRISPYDSNARRHTSFASVTIYPVVDDRIIIDINESDVRVDTMRAQGAGGQHVNKTDSAIRITHLPTGVVVECQDERSQHKNRSRAMSLLRARLLEAQRQKQTAQQAQERKLQVGTGDRSERIRTYNYPQGRVTDHRINLTLYQLPAIMEGALADVIGPLQQEWQAEQLAQLE